jgi:hypothetical protein
MKELYNFLRSDFYMRVIVAFFIITNSLASSLMRSDLDYNLKKHIEIMVDKVKYSLYKPCLKEIEGKYEAHFPSQNLDDKGIETVFSSLESEIIKTIQAIQVKADKSLLSLCYERHPYMASILILACTTSMLYSSYRLIKSSRKKVKKAS